MQLEALIRAYHNTDMKPGKHVSNVRLQVNERKNAAAAKRDRYIFFERENR